MYIFSKEIVIKLLSKVLYLVSFYLCLYVFVKSDHESQEQLNE